MMKVYISGKITGLDLKEAEAKFQEAEDYLLNLGLGLEVVNPMKLVPFCPTLTWHDYMEKDIAALLKCDAIYMLEDWIDSKGARIELAIAREMSMLILKNEPKYLNI